MFLVGERSATCVVYGVRDFPCTLSGPWPTEPSQQEALDTAKSSLVGYRTLWKTGNGLLRHRRWYAADSIRLLRQDVFVCFRVIFLALVQRITGYTSASRVESLTREISNNAAYQKQVSGLLDDSSASNARSR